MILIYIILVIILLKLLLIIIKAYVKTRNNRYKMQKRKYRNQYKNYKKKKNKAFDNLTDREFEFYCADYLLKQGFQDVEVTKATNDGGMDIIATKNNKKYIAECKHYTGKVGRPIIQKLQGAAVSEEAIGIVMTSSEFTDTALQYAKYNGIILIDGNDFK